MPAAREKQGKRQGAKEQPIPTARTEKLTEKRDPNPSLTGFGTQPASRPQAPQDPSRQGFCSSPPATQTLLPGSSPMALTTE